MEKLINRVGLSWVYDQIKLDLINIYNLLINNKDSDFNNIGKNIDKKLCHIAKVFYLLNISAGVSFINEFRLNLKYLTLNEPNNTEKIINTASKIEQVLNYIEDIIQGYGDLPIYYVSVIDSLREIRGEIFFSQCSYIVNTVKQQNISDFDCEFTNLQKNNINSSLVYLLKNYNCPNRCHDKVLKNANNIKNDFKGTQHYILWDIVSAYLFLSKNYNYEYSKVAEVILKKVIENYNAVFGTLDFDKIAADIPGWIAVLSFDLLNSGYFNFIDKKLCKFINKVVIINDKKTLTNYMYFAERMIATDSWILLLDISSELDLAINKLQESKHKKRLDINWLLGLIQKHIDSCVLIGMYDPVEFYYETLRNINQYTITGGFISVDDLDTIEELILSLTSNVEQAIQATQDNPDYNDDIYAKFADKSIIEVDLDARDELLKQQLLDLDEISSRILIESNLNKNYIEVNFAKIKGIFKLIKFSVGESIVNSYIEKIDDIANAEQTISDSLKQNIIVFIKYLSELIKAVHNEQDYDFHVKQIRNLINSLEVASLGEQKFSTKESFVDHVDNNEGNRALELKLPKDSYFPEQIQSRDQINLSSGNSLKQIFFEEFSEINDSVRVLFNKWHDDICNISIIDSLQREFHTLKGAARMVGFTVISDWIHHLESSLESCSQNLAHIEQHHVNTLMQAYNKSIDLIAAYKVNIIPDLPSLLNLQYDDYHFKNVDKNLDNIAYNFEQGKSLSLAALLNDSVADKSQSDNNSKYQQHKYSAIPLRDTVRVNKDELDELLDSACELSISQHQLVQQSNNIASITNKLSKIVDSIANNPLDYIKQLTNIVKELQALRYNYNNITDGSDKNINSIFNKLINLRMVPLNAIKDRLEYLVNSISNELGKKIIFNISKSEGSIDCVVLEQITPSLEHLIRNAIDHGIETPDIREQHGKDTYGKLELKLYTKEQAVIIELYDDGAGLNLEKVEKKAKEFGIIDNNASLTIDDILPVITSSKFSTCDTVSQISGRGMGLNIVKNTVSQLCGTLELDSKANLGTKFIIKLPYSLAKQSLLFIKITDLYYAIPSLIVDEIIKVPTNDITLFKNNFIYKDIIIYNLYDLLNLDNGADKFKVEPDKLHNLVIINLKNIKLGLLVEDICETRESVIRPLSPQLRKLTEFMGGTIYQDGRVVLVLDIITMLSTNKNSKSLTANKVVYSKNQNLYRDVTIDSAETPDYKEPKNLGNKNIVYNKPTTNLAESELPNNYTEILNKFNQPDEEVSGLEQEQARKTTILVVEDSATVRHAVQSYLNLAHFNIVTAVDGVDGLKK